MIKMEFMKANLDEYADDRKVYALKESVDKLIDNLQIVLESINGDLIDPGEFELTEKMASDAVKRAIEASRIAGNTNQYVWRTQEGLDTGLHITEKAKDDFLEDPENGKGNLLARSNGIALRDGLTDLLTVSGDDGATIGKNDENHANINNAGMTLYDEYGTPMFQVDAMASPTEKSRTVTQTENEAEVTTDSSGRKTWVWTFRHTPILANTVYVDFYQNGTAISGEFGLHFDDETPQNTFTYSSKNFTATISGDKLTLKQTSGTPITGTISTEYLYYYNGYDPAFTLGNRADGRPVGAFSFVQGDINSAEAEYSVAQGLATRAKAPYSHADGMDTIAGGFAQYVCGQFNVEDTGDEYLMIVGNGQRDTARSNALAVTNAGNLKARGGIFTGCGADSSGGASVWGDMMSTYLTASQSITNTVASLNMSTYLIKGSAFSLTSTTGLIQCNFSGYAMASGWIRYSGLTNGDRVEATIGVYRNGSYIDGLTRPSFFGGTFGSGTVANLSIPDTPIQVKNGDIIALRTRNFTAARGSAYRAVLNVRKLSEE